MTATILDRKKDSQQRAKQYKSLSARELIELKNTDPGLYTSLRKGMVEMGLLTAQPGTHRGLEVRHLVETPTVHSDAEIALMIQYPREVCEKFYKPNTQLNDENFILAKQTPEARENIRNASILHNVIVGELRHHRSVEPPAVKIDDGRIEAGSLGALAGIPPTERITHHQYNTLLEADARRLAARTPAQVAQDHAAALRIAADKAQADADNAAKDKS
jgi:hypothetical protein